MGIKIAMKQINYHKDSKQDKYKREQKKSMFQLRYNHD